MKINNLKHTETKLIKYEGESCDLIVKIRLNDECKNGHQDFAITGDVFRTGHRSDRYHYMGGCIHEIILKHFPEFKIFVDLHLCDFEGSPMYPSANGFYHLKKGFERLNGKTQKDYFCEYYRITSEQYDVICKSENELEFSILLGELGILKQWKKQANKAIKILEKLTGEEFLNDSIKTQHTKPTAEQIKEFKILQKSGYYSPEQKKIRAIEKRKADKTKVLKEIFDRAQKDINKATEERDVKMWLVNKIDKLAEKPLNIAKGFLIDFSFENFIFYNHSKEIKFNWLPYKKLMTEKEFDIFCNSLNESDFNKLPSNIKFILEGVKQFAK